LKKALLPLAMCRLRYICIGLHVPGHRFGNNTLLAVYSGKNDFKKSFIWGTHGYHPVFKMIVYFLAVYLPSKAEL
jgi:hypothetical protein